jgi:Ca-activated chloride channel family protein
MGRQLVHLRVGIQAAEPPEFVQLPSNIVFLVDTSGSMEASNKLPLVQHLLRETLNVLTGPDTVSIVTYAGSTAVRLRPTPTRERDAIVRAIDSLRASGGTAGGAGIQLAYEQARAGFIEGGFNHVILCTDGDFNIGISDTDALVALIEEERRSGVTLTALGFGSGNLNDAMMERVSNAGNGIYSVITSEAHATRYAADEMLRTVHHVAKDMKIQVEFNPEHVLAYRLLGYENRAIADMDFRVDTVDAGEVGAGHRVTALYELVLTGQEIPMAEGAPAPLAGERVEGAAEIDPADFVLVKVRWKDLGASEEDPAHETSATLTPEDIAGMTGAADDDLMWAAAIASFAEILKESPYAEDADLDAIDAIVTPQGSRDEDRGRFVTLFGEARRLLGR